MKCKLIIYLSSGMIAMGIPAILVGNSNYSLALMEDTVTGLFMHRRLDLKIDGELAGYIRYSIPNSDSCIDGEGNSRSSIDVLYVEKKFRGNRGCGKMLLHSAISDILFHRCQEISLNRCPFDLAADEKWDTRDKELKNWYGKFGFLEKTERGSVMQITDPAKIYATQVITAFTQDGPIFLFR